MAEGERRLSMILFSEELDKSGMISSMDHVGPFHSSHIHAATGFLGVVHFQKRELQYLDSIPLPENLDMSKHRAQWVSGNVPAPTSSQLIPTMPDTSFPDPDTRH